MLSCLSTWADLKVEGVGVVRGNCVEMNSALGPQRYYFTNSTLSCMRVILNNIEILEMGWLFRHLPYSVLLHISGPGPHTNFLSLLAKS